MWKKSINVLNPRDPLLYGEWSWIVCSSKVSHLVLACFISNYFVCQLPYDGGKILFSCWSCVLLILLHNSFAISERLSSQEILEKELGVCYLLIVFKHCWIIYEKSLKLLHRVQKLFFCTILVYIYVLFISSPVEGDFNGCCLSLLFEVKYFVGTLESISLGWQKPKYSRLLVWLPLFLL